MSEPNPPDAVPGDDPQPSNRPIDEEAVSTDLDDGEDGPDRISQEAVGRDMARGGGEFPSPDTPPSGPAPGTAGMTPEREPADETDPPERFKDVLDTDPERFGSSTTPDD